MITSILLSIGIIIIIMLSMAGLSEITYQLFGKGKKLRLRIHSDDDFKKELNIEGGDKLLNILQKQGISYTFRLRWKCHMRTMQG